MQVHLYYMGSKKDVPANLRRYMLERELIEKYHWTPNQIAKIPFKWLQEYYMFEKAKSSGQATRQELDKN